MIMDEMIKDRTFMRMGMKTTICLVTLDNGYEVVGSSACVDPNNFDFNIGKEWAWKDAKDKLGDIEGFILTEHRHIALEKIKQLEEEEK